MAWVLDSLLAWRVAYVCFQTPLPFCGEFLVVPTDRKTCRSQLMRRSFGCGAKECPWPDALLFPRPKGMPGALASGLWFPLCECPYPTCYGVYLAMLLLQACPKCLTASSPTTVTSSSVGSAGLYVPSCWSASNTTSVCCSVLASSRGQPMPLRALAGTAFPDVEHALCRAQDINYTGLFYTGGIFIAI